MRVAVVQTAPRRGRGAENAKRALDLMASCRADLFVLPELAFSGYNFASREEARKASVRAGEGPLFKALGDFARRRGAHVAFGFPERAGRRLYNAAALVGPRGVLGVYRKIHLFGQERRFFSPGNFPFTVWDLPGVRVGLLICFDWIFPEAARSLALAGAQLLVHPANLVLPHCPAAMITRCLENRVFAATADRVGTERGGAGPLAFIGRSQVVGPAGDVRVRLGGREEGVAVAAIDPAAARDKRLASGNDLFRERRPGLYAV